MDTLDVKNITFRGMIKSSLMRSEFEQLHNFSYQFNFGKSYFLDSEIGSGGWAVSWILGGLIEPTQGTITRNSSPYGKRERTKDSWCVRETEIKRFGLFRNLPLGAQIRHGLKSIPDQYLASEAEIIDRFHLSSALYMRLLRQFSNEGWRASCAIGMAHAKRIFWFPNLDIHPNFIEDDFRLWLPEIIGLLRDSGALVLVPAKMRKAAEGLCDEVVLLDKGLS